MKWFLFVFAFIHLSSFSQNCIFDEEFAGKELNSKLWKTQPNYGPNINAWTDLNTFKPENVII